MYRPPRAVEQRRALGRTLRAHRMALGFTVRQVMARIGTGKGQMQAIESGNSDIVVGTLIDVAAVYGLHVALAADHHLPLLELTRAETLALLDAATSAGFRLPDGHPTLELLAALTSSEPA